ncbi:MAG TPA: MBOAT family O-acyltransferase, partial [bacterium]|nr:MBOAT family O-acyltransferase [bacterium]
MLFNSVQFFIFFGLVYSLYLVSRHRWQNRILLAASLIFYAAWDWRFLSLILLTVTTDYTVGLKIAGTEDPRKRKNYLLISLVSNLTILGFFKYFNFFIGNFEALLRTMGLPVSTPALHIVLPVGISFYTFQSLSYVIDIYRRDLKPTSRYFDYALYISFFPQLVAGPIERATHLLPQVLSPRKVTLEKFYSGCYLIFWGLFQKVFVADNLVKLVDPVFASGPPYDGFKVLTAVYAFAFQIYCDFAGYSNIARGLGQCMGFDIMFNFNLPYFSTNPREFWKRWHISLSTWLRDYLYIPLGGNRKGTWKTYRNLILTMLLGGLWHGASWTYIFWGAYHGLLLVIHRMSEPFFGTLRAVKKGFLEKTWFAVRVVFFFHFICLGWLFFRAKSIGQAFLMLKSLVYDFQLPPLPQTEGIIFSFLFFTLVLLLVQLFQYQKQDLMAIFKSNVPARASFYVVCFYLLIMYGASGDKAFI